MALRNLNKLYPMIDGGASSKFGVSKFTFIKTDTEPPDYVEGTVYFDDSEETLKLRTSSAWVALGVGATAGTGLDGAYDINPTITVDGATITLAASSNDALTITQSANKEGINLTKTGSGAGYPIQIQNSGSGEDIYGTSGTWKVDKAGAATFTTVTGTDLAMTGTQTITTDDTSGVAINIEADSLTTGTAIEVDSNTGANVTLLDLQNAGTSVMTVGGTGIVTLAGVAKDADAIVITDGDITLTDGDLDLTSGQFTMITDGAGDGMALTDKTGAVNYDLLYLNGSTNSGSAHILSIAQGASTRTGNAIDIAMGTTAVAMSAIDIACTGGTRTAPIIAIDSDGTASDFIEMQNSVIFTGNFIEMIQDTGAGTGNFIFINNDSGTSMEAINIDDEANTVDIIKVDSAGVLGAGKAQISLTQSAGGVNATANAIYVDWSADVDANTPVMLSMTSSGRDIGAMNIVTDAATDDGIYIDGGGATANDKALLSLAWTGTPANAGANMLRLDCTGADTTVVPVLIEVIAGGETAQALNIDADCTTVPVVAIHGGGVLTNGLGVLNLTNDGNLAAGGNLLNVTMGGTPADATVCAVEIVAAKDCLALDIASSAAATHCAQIIGSGATADNMAVLNLEWGAITPANAGSNLLRVDGSAATTTNKPVLCEILDDSVAVGLSVTTASIEDMVTFIGTGATGNDKGVVDITSTATLNVGGNLLRVDGSGATTTSKPVLLEVLDDSVATAASFTSLPTGNHVVLVAAGGAMTDGYAGLMVTSSGNLATGGAASHIVISGSPTNDSRAFEIDAQKDMRALYIDTDAATNNACEITSSGVIATGKAILAITNTAAMATGSYMIDLTTGANFASSTASYLLHVDAAHTNVEGIHVDAGNSKFDEGVGVGNWTVEARTVTSDGSGTGTISNDVNCVQLTSTDTDYWAILPAPTPGKEVWIIADATSACELQSSAPSSVSINNVAGATSELTILADTTYHALCINATNWIVEKWDNAGTPGAGGTPD